MVDSLDKQIEIIKKCFNTSAQLVEKEIAYGKIVYPPKGRILSSLIPIGSIKVVIIGQDPYHGEGQANGLAFSVNKNIAIPPSLRNIFLELYQDVGVQIPQHGDLSSWANQGVLLLNRVLTVEKDLPRSHKDLRWQEFTNNLVMLVSKETTNTVFILWGKDAAELVSCIDDSKHLILKAPHPSPLSASRGFFGCKHFSKTNEYLRLHGKKPIDWSIVD